MPVLKCAIALGIAGILARGLLAVSYAHALEMTDPTGILVRATGPDGATGTLTRTTTTSSSGGTASGSSGSGGSAAGGSSGTTIHREPTFEELMVAQRIRFGGDGSPQGWLPMVYLVPPGNLPYAPAPVGASGPAGAGVALPAVPPVVLAQQAAATLKLPSQTVRVGPDPSMNRWNMLAVGYPLWLWREGPSTMSQSVALGGATLTMKATQRSTTYDMGDGTTLTCTASTPWVAGAQPPGTPSPTCGHTYTRPGTFTITATHHWDLAWSAMGESGTLPLTNGSSTTVEVGELASVVIGR